MIWWKPSKPDEIKPIPWLAPDAVVYLESILTPDMDVIEHGSGGSTLWFAARVALVYAYESDPDWQREVKRQAPKGNVSVFGRPRTETLETGFSQPFDILFIDGEPVMDRATWIKTAPKIVHPGGWVVLDNANRPEYATEREGLKQFADLVKTFDGNDSGHKYLITEFWKVRE